MDSLTSDVLAFWFGPLDASGRTTAREVWYRKDPEFDAEIRTRFGGAVSAALAGGYGEWCITASGALARVILLDQFTRNIFRDTPRAFAGDERALATAQDAVKRGLDRELEVYHRWFLYMPFEHSEDPGIQHRSLELFAALAREMGDHDPLDWAQRHADVISRFGRYPHRNAILGRASTPEEIEYLAQPGAGF